MKGSGAQPFSDWLRDGLRANRAPPAGDIYSGGVGGQDGDIGSGGVAPACGADGAELLRMHGRGREFVRRADGVGGYLLEASRSFAWHINK